MAGDDLHVVRSSAILAARSSPLDQTQALNLSAGRVLAFAASSSRFFGGAFVSRERSSRVDAAATSSMAAANDASLAFDGLLKPVIFLTNCSDAARISSSLTGGSKLKRVLIFLHMERDLPNKPSARFSLSSSPQRYLQQWIDPELILKQPPD